MAIEIRPITEDEFPPYVAANATGFGYEPEMDRMEDTRAIHEFDRTLAAFDGEEIVGTAAIYSFDLTVPGAALPAAGVTWVGVKPTHRRQGVLRQIMQRQLNDVRERGEAIAALWASESIIYGRFGYGLAAEDVDLKIDRTMTEFARPVSAPGRMRLISREEALSGWPAVYDRVLPEQPGMYSRSETWWKHKSLRKPEKRGGSAKFFAQYEEDGQVLGYAIYRVQLGHGILPAGTVTVQELTAATGHAYTALWQYIFGIDLIATIEAPRRRVDEPLLWLLADPRRLHRRPYDSLWVRLVDVAAALEGRRYASEGEVVLEVEDRLCPWNSGRYALEGGPEGARCRHSDATPQILLDVADLGSVYLGGARLQTLSRAGRVQGDAEALNVADAMFSWNPAPWCPEVF